jgi:hypothetical protein
MRGFATIAFLGLASVLCGQDDTGMVRYRGGFDFAEGIYLRFEAFRDNAPDLPLKELTDGQGRPAQDLLRGEKLFHPDSTGARVPVDLDAVWGVCNNNVIHLRAGDGLYRIGMMGTLCHVLYESSYQDWSNAGFMMGGPVTRTVQEQRILDMETGDYLAINAATMEELLKRDEVLYAQWSEIPVKKRKEEVIFQYMRRYNELHPLHFPATRP